MYISEYMKWDGHVRSLSSKLSKFCYVVKFLTDVTSPCVTRNIYFAYFHAHMRYGLVFWGGDSRGKKVFRLLKRVIQIMSGVRRYPSCRQLFKDLSILPIPCI
jgi:hypothetical protein